MEELLREIDINPMITNKFELAKNKYNFSLEKLLALKSNLVTFLIMQRNLDGVEEYLDEMIETIFNMRDLKPLKEKCLLKTIDFIYDNSQLSEADQTKILVENYITNGYYFHNFNAFYFDEINQHGFNSNPEREEDLKVVHRILSGIGIYPFGFHNPEDKEITFFTGHPYKWLYYGMTAPGWFNHFINGGMGDKSYNAFYHRDYEVARHLVERHYLIRFKEEAIQDFIINFFEKHWRSLATRDESLMAMVPRRAVNNQDTQISEIDQNNRQGFMRLFNLHCSGDIIVRNHIPPEDIIIVAFNRNSTIAR